MMCDQPPLNPVAHASSAPRLSIYMWSRRGRPLRWGIASDAVSYKSFFIRRLLSIPPRPVLRHFCCFLLPSLSLPSQALAPRVVVSLM
jgi:hypothetical protein